MYFDAHFHLFDDTLLGNTLANNIGEKPDRDYFFGKYHSVKGAVGGVVMGNGPLEKQGENLPENFFYMAGLDEPSYFPLKEKIYIEIKRHLESSKCVGVKLYPGYVPVYPNDTQYVPVFELCAKHNKVLAVHTGMPAGLGAKMKYTKPIHLDDIAVDFPDLRIVMCHFGNPFLEEAAAVMEHNKNVYADLSGLIEGKFAAETLLESEHDYLKLLRTWIHYVGDSSRFIFGTDWPAVNCFEYKKFIAHIIAPDWIDDVMIHNALDIYNIHLKGL